MTTMTDPVVARWWQLLHGSQMSGGQGYQRIQKGQTGWKTRSKQARRTQIELHQMDLYGNNNHPSEAWGDVLTIKWVGTCRIGLLNLSGFTTCGGSAKNDQLQRFMEDIEVDILNFPEVNVCWHCVTPRNQLEDHTMGWFETLHKSVAYNYTDRQPPQHQFGGNVLISINDAANCMLDSNHDSTGLG